MMPTTTSLANPATKVIVQYSLTDQIEIEHENVSSRISPDRKGRLSFIQASWETN